MRRNSGKGEACGHYYRCWISIIQESDIDIAVHYNNNSTILKSHMLQCISFNESRTGENLARKIKAIYEKCGGIEKVQAVTTHNAANAQKAIMEISNKCNVLSTKLI